MKLTTHRLALDALALAALALAVGACATPQPTFDSRRLPDGAGQVHQTRNASFESRLSTDQLLNMRVDEPELGEPRFLLQFEDTRAGEADRGDTDSLELEVDGEAFELPFASASRAWTSGSGSGGDTYARMRLYRADAALFRRMARAEEIRFRVPGSGGVFSTATEVARESYRHFVEVYVEGS